MDDVVNRAVEIVGGPTQASFVCRVSVGAVYKWRKLGYVPNSRAALRLAEASGISVERLAGLVADSVPSKRRKTKAAA